MCRCARGKLCGASAASAGRARCAPAPAENMKHCCAGRARPAQAGETHRRRYSRADAELLQAQGRLRRSLRAASRPTSGPNQARCGCEAVAWARCCTMYAAALRRFAGQAAPADSCRRQRRNADGSSLRYQCFNVRPPRGSVHGCSRDQARSGVRAKQAPFQRSRSHDGAGNAKSTTTPVVRRHNSGALARAGVGCATFTTRRARGPPGGDRGPCQVVATVHRGVSEDGKAARASTPRQWQVITYPCAMDLLVYADVQAWRKAP